MKDNLYIIIIAGGDGRRLWPVSRRTLPKQFIDVFGTGETLLQTACLRAARIVGEKHVIVVTNKDYSDLMESQLPWFPKENILKEPVHRNTCPAAAWAVHRVMMDSEAGNDAVVALMPSDQLIIHEDRFEKALLEGAGYVSLHNTVLTMGATPTRTEPGYGYIQIDADTDDVLSKESASKGRADAEANINANNNANVWRVKSFVEKPDREFARMLIESGEFLWNTGIYMARVGCIREQFKALLPYVLRDVRSNVDEENDFIRENYSRYPNLSLDLAILEKMPDRSVMHCDFGWADIGTWHGIYEAVPNDADENVVVNQRSHVICDGSHRNIISLPDGKLAILSGMEGMIVAESDNVLLICPKGDSSAMVRKFLAKVENDDHLGKEYV